METRIWDCYPATIRTIADLLDRLNDDEFDEDFKVWLTDGADDDVEGSVQMLPPDERHTINNGFGFGWIISNDIEDLYGVCLYETPYSDFTLSATQLRWIADIIDGIDDVQTKAQDVTTKVDQMFGLSAKVTLVRGGDESDVLGVCTDHIGGAYSFVARQP